MEPEAGSRKPEAESSGQPGGSAAGRGSAADREFIPIEVFERDGDASAADLRAATLADSMAVGGEKELEADDPLEFVAARFPVPDGIDIDAVTARVFVEEYALMGMPRRKVLQMFASPAFAGTHSIFLARGQDFVEAIIDDVFGPASTGVH
jgi:hypothetical protein